MRRSITFVLASLLAFGGMGWFSIASAAEDVVRRGSCTDGGRWRLELTDQGRRIEVDFEVHRSPAGDRWAIRMKHDGDQFFDGARRADDRGDASVDVFVKDRSGADRFVVRATDGSTGEVCRGSASI